MTFIAYNKDKERLVVVYAVRDDSNGYPQFLIYEDNQWKWISAKHFEPVGGDNK